MGKARAYIPALQFGHKIYPEDIAGLLGLPVVGSIFYVDPSGGSDTANSGSEADNALKTVAAAYAKMTSGKNDTVVIAPTGGTGRTAETSLITWGKRFAHIIGASAPTAQDTRAGMNFAGASGTATASLTISENGCLFKNLTLTGTDDVNVPVTITGDYNSFLGVDFKGMLNATTGDDTAARSLLLSGAQENYFGGCTFGHDTTMKSAANGTLEFASASSRNVFEDCKFVMAADATSPYHVLFSGTNSVDRWVEFEDTVFYAFYTNHADQPTHVFDLGTQTATADVILSGNSMHVGFDDWEATASGILWVRPSSATTTAIGQAVHPTVG